LLLLVENSDSSMLGTSLGVQAGTPRARETRCFHVGGPSLSAHIVLANQLSYL
jgi:hypothetical protein